MVKYSICNNTNVQGHCSTHTPVGFRWLSEGYRQGRNQEITPINLFLENTDNMGWNII